MDERGKFGGKRAERVKDVVAEVPKQSTIKEERILLRSIYDSKLRYAGQASGELYIWERIGSVVAVLPEDVPYLLNKRIGGRGCCGAVNSEGNKLFEKA